MPISRATDLAPKLLIEELTRLYRINPKWLTWKNLEGGGYQAQSKLPTWTRDLWVSGADAFSMWALSIWAGEGPKIFRPTLEQCKALEQVEVRLELNDYAQPYKVLCVDLPPKEYGPFTAILCHLDYQDEFAKQGKMFSGVLITGNHFDEITTTVTVDGRPMEESLIRFDEDCRDQAPLASKVLRVGINACLALVNYGNQAALLFPKEEERDRKLGRENSERGRNARWRAKTSPRLISFPHEVRLYHTEGGHPAGEGTGKERPIHWRRGHWHTVLHGVGKTLRKLKLYKPVLVRADKALGEEPITTVYKK